MARAITHQPFPWESGHASPQDQALGLELELIELVRQRSDEADGASARAVRLDGEIDAVLTQLDELVAHMPVAV